MINDKIGVGIGEILWDLLPTGKILGGAPANFAFHLNSLGIKSFPVSAVGSDDLGNEILGSLKHKSLSTDYIQINSDFSTGTVDVKLDETGKPVYIIHQNVAWDNIVFNDMLEELASKCNAVCFGSLAQRNDASRKTIFEFLSKTSDKAIKVFDINLRQEYYSEQIIRTCLNSANILKLNDDELDVVADLMGYKGEEGELLAKIQNDFNLDSISYTKGDKGSMLILRDKTSFQEPEKVDIVDTVGAGDAFTAGLVYGLLNDLELDKIHQIANGLATFVCTKKGATPAISDDERNKIINI
jgi:fructokinase